MSIFSSLRRSRQQAKEHNAKLAEQKKKEAAQIPYKHVPTHAATDAFASAPPSWREADRPRIVEENRRRSAMAASGHHMNMPGVPRVGSSLSRVSYPGEDMTPVIRLPRTCSYTGVPSYMPSARESREMMYLAPQDMPYMPASLKGKEVPRVYDLQRISPTSSKSGPSPLDSSDGSRSSQDDLEMKPSRPKARPAAAVTTHHLHPSHARRKSDVSVNQYTLSSTIKSSHTSHHRDSRPPPSMRGFASIPAVAAMLPTNMGANSGYFPPPAHGSSSSSKSSPPSTVTPPSRQGSATSLCGPSSGPVKQPVSPPVTSYVSAAEKDEHGLNWHSSAEPDADTYVSSFGAAAGSSFAAHGETTSSKVPPSQRLGNSRRNTMEPRAASPQQRVGRSRAPSLTQEHQLANVFPEMAMPDAQEKLEKSRKLSKGGAGKYLNKNRWSTSKVPIVSV
ncbi:hypothetical protein E4U41_004229 [Claviceps citrina]|nr:hypothetical protein E4U41_004229 [Claviceps citrina]